MQVDSCTFFIHLHSMDDEWLWCNMWIQMNCVFYFHFLTTHDPYHFIFFRSNLWFLVPRFGTTVAGWSPRSRPKSVPRAETQPRRRSWRWRGRSWATTWRLGCWPLVFAKSVGKWPKKTLEEIEENTVIELNEKDMTNPTWVSSNSFGAWYCWGTELAAPLDF